jgi:tripartite ATP-independent transporter DctM subunit
MVLGIFLISFAIFFLFGMPIAASMICSAFLYCFIEGIDLMFMGTQMFTGLNSFVLIAIPLFILTAEVMNRTSVSDRIFNFCNALVGYIPGGLGHVNIATSIIFAGMSGSAVADVGGIGHLSYRAMVDEGFDEEFSACVTISSSTIGPIIPPSIPAVVYAMVANVSVGRLLFGGVVPGFLMGAVLMAYVYVVSKKSKYPKKNWISWKVYIRDLLYSFIKSLLPMLTPAILLGSIYTGIVTTTEAAALAVLYSLILGFILYRTMNVKAFISSLKSVFITSGSILLLLPAAKVFSFVMTKENLQNTIYSGITSFAGDNKILIGACIILLFLVLGCLSDPNVNIMLFVPMVLPLILAAGFDPIHMGIVIIVTAMIGNITPPVGIVLQTTTSIEKLSFEKVSKALIPFIILLIVFVIVLAFIPQIILFLPNLILG